MKRLRNTVAVSFAVLVFALASSALGQPSGKGRGGATGTGYTVTLTPGPYSFGGSVYATTNVPVSMTPYLWMRCFQNGILVGSADHAAFPTGWYYGWPFTFGPTMKWSGGAADCTFTVVHISRRKVVTDASTTIHVNG